jgi:uncharacterized SAM-binding protein YcdF (DUF218 family)
MIHGMVKIFTDPLIFIWIGLLIILYKSRGNRRQLVMFNIIFYCLCNGFIGFTLLRLWPVSDSYNKNTIYDAAIILVGIIDPNDLESIGDNDYDFRYSKVNNRLSRGVGFVKSGHAKLLLFGNWPNKYFEEGPVIRKFAEYKGLKENEIKIYGDVQKTLDEVRGIKIFLEESKYQNVILITSEIHMRRTLAMFNKVGISPETYSVDKEHHRTNWKDFVPSTSGAGRVKRFLYELLGYLGYYLKGDI